MESQYFNQLMSVVAQDTRFNSEMEIAKKEFQDFAGPIYESDRSFDARINSFHNWYILDRPLKDKGVIPLKFFLELHYDELNEEDLKGYRELEQNLHSVFELIGPKSSRTRVRDLLSGKKIDVEGVEGTEFIDKGCIFNTRIFTHEGRNLFSNYFLLHPLGVNKTILAEAKKVRKAKAGQKEFLFKLVLFQSRYDQYEQMELKNIYRFGS
ncbi:MAG: hypothetical protein OEZ59_07940 [Deltaproteobacteria bacterium]|nr:hypothetical protein [Deltaproteobacteria bacterium]